MNGFLVAWRRWDGWLMRATELLLFVTGVTLTALVTMEVISRFVFSFSIFFTNAMARYLLVWFFLLGAGPALRRGAHVGFNMIAQALPEPFRVWIEALAHLLVLGFFGLMIWAGLGALPQALTERESAMGVSSAWGMAAIPVGFALLLYHQGSVMLERQLGTLRNEGRGKC